MTTSMWSFAEAQNCGRGQVFPLSGLDHGEPLQTTKVGYAVRRFGKATEGPVKLEKTKDASPHQVRGSFIYFRLDADDLADESYSRESSAVSSARPPAIGIKVLAGRHLTTQTAFRPGASGVSLGRWCVLYQQRLGVRGYAFDVAEPDSRTRQLRLSTTAPR